MFYTNNPNHIITFEIFFSKTFIFFKLLILVATIFVVLISRYNKEFADYRIGEYYVLITIMVFGLFLMVSAVVLIMIYLTIETVSIMLFILTGYLKSGNQVSRCRLIRCYRG